MLFAKQHMSKSLASLATFRNLALMVALLAVTTALILISTATQAQASNGAVPNLQLSSVSPGELTIAWDAPDPAPSDYRVIWARQDLDFLSYKNSNEANQGNEYPSGSERSITLPGLAKGQTFKVRARARYTSGGQNNGPWSGPWTDTITTRVMDDPPAAPNGLTAGQVTHDSVTLTWTAPSSGSTVAAYRVLRGTDADSLSTIAQDTGNTGTEYTDTTVAAETTYHYAVLALSQDGDGMPSATISVTTPAEPQPPAAPTGLRASQVAHNSVTLSWTDPEDTSITGYRILRGTEAGKLSAIAQDTGNTDTEYTDSTVATETTYHYAVLALSQNGDGAQSATVSATTPTASEQTRDTPPVERSSHTPSAPRNLAFAAGNGSLTFTWNPPASGSADLLRYNYTLSVVSTNGRVVSGDITTNLTGHQTYQRTGLTNGTAYRFEVRGVNSNGAGAYAHIQATPGTPSVPLNLTVVHGDTTMSVSWDLPFVGTPLLRYNHTIKVLGTDVLVEDANTTTNLTERQTYTKTGLTNGTTYYFQVRGVSSSGAGLFARIEGTPTANVAATGVPGITLPNALRVPAILHANMGTIVDPNGFRTEWDTNGFIPPTDFKWQWLRQITGFNYADIPGATGQTYRLTDADVGKQLQLRVSFTDDGGNEEGPFTGTATGVRATAAAECKAPDPISYSTGSRHIQTMEFGIGQIKSGDDVTFRGFSPDAPGSTLTNPWFHGTSGTHSIESLLLDTNSGGLYLTTKDRMSRQEEKHFTLYICDGAYHFYYAIRAGNKALFWHLSKRGWDDHSVRTLYIYRDTTPPRLESVEGVTTTSGSTLTLNFSEDMYFQNSPPNSAFTVKKTPAGGSEETVTLSGNPNREDKTITLPLTAPFLPTDRVTLSYTKPEATSQRLADRFGNEVENFTDVPVRKRHEPSGQDFSHSADTLGFVSVGQDSSGRLPDRSDHRGDTFNLVGLEPSRTYRVEVVFKSAGSTQRFFNERYFRWDSYPTTPTVGGDIWLEQCCYLDRLYPVGEWDSNYDGRAIFDFKTGRGESGNTHWVTIIPDNYMKPNVRFYGEYTVTLTDVTGLRKLVSNTSQRDVTVAYANVGKSTAVTPNTTVQRSIAFTTGGHANGYTLDRITAYISLTDGTDTGTGVPKVAIHADGTDKPGTKLCDLQMLADYETGLNLSNGDWPDRLYAPDCADNTLAASTTYWIVFSEDSSEAQTYWVGRANESDEDPHGASGWSIGNSQAGKVGEGDWMPTVTGGALAIGVYGTPK